MSSMDPIGVRDACFALRDGNPKSLVGLRECAWLDVKSGIYALESPHAKEELAKDVAGFANNRDGGLILVGFSTELDHGEEVVRRLKPVPRRLVNLDQHRKVIAERVMPPPQGLELWWVDCGDERGVLVIHVPAQPASRLPFVVPGPHGQNNLDKVSIGLPIRMADRTVWQPQAEVRRLLAAGWAHEMGAVQKVVDRFALWQRDFDPVFFPDQALREDVLGQARTGRVDEDVLIFLYEAAGFDAQLLSQYAPLVEGLPKVAEVLARALGSHYRRPKYRIAFVMQYWSDENLELALSQAESDSSVDRAGRTLMAAIRRRDVYPHIAHSPDLDEDVRNDLLATAKRYMQINGRPPQQGLR